MFIKKWNCEKNKKILLIIVLSFFCFFDFLKKGKIEESYNYHIRIIGGHSDHLGYLQSNSLYSSMFTSALKQATFVRIGPGLSGYIRFYEKKSTEFVEELLKLIFNTYVADVIQFVTPLFDYKNWVKKFEFDYSNRVFYDFFFFIK